jgi:hypothetical protein
VVFSAGSRQRALPVTLNHPSIPGNSAQTVHNAITQVVGEVQPSTILAAAMEIVPIINMQPAPIAIRSIIPLPPVPNAMIATTLVVEVGVMTNFHAVPKLKW